MVSLLPSRARRTPGEADQRRSVVAEARDGRAGNAHVDDDELVRVVGRLERERGHVVLVLPVPADAQQRAPPTRSSCSAYVYNRSSY